MRKKVVIIVVLLAFMGIAAFMGATGARAQEAPSSPPAQTAGVEAQARAAIAEARCTARMEGSWLAGVCPTAEQADAVYQQFRGLADSSRRFPKNCSYRPGSDVPLSCDTRIRIR